MYTASQSDHPQARYWPSMKKGTPRPIQLSKIFFDNNICNLFPLHFPHSLLFGDRSKKHKVQIKILAAGTMPYKKHIHMFLWWLQGQTNHRSLITDHVFKSQESKSEPPKMPHIFLREFCKKFHGNRIKILLSYFLRPVSCFHCSLMCITSLCIVNTICLTFTQEFMRSETS